jgi:ArsR family transcriptional regulator
MMIDMLKAIADGNRFEIMRLLSQEALCVCEIEAKLNIPQNLVSHHLSVLKKVGLIDNCRCGKKNYYSINKQSLNKLTNTLKKLGE